MTPYHVLHNTMRTVDEILNDADSGGTPKTAENAVEIERYSRTRNIDRVRELSKINGYRTTAYLVLQWIMIIGALAAAGYYAHPLVYVAAAFVISSRLQALGVLLHDGAHYLLYKNRSVNDVVSDLFVAFPIGMSTTLYRRTHFRHHRYANTEEDQDLAAQQQEHEWYEWPKTRWQCFLTIVRSLLGFNFLKGWILYKHWAPWNNFRNPDFPPRSRILYVVSTAIVYSGFAVAIKLDPYTAISLLLLYMISGATLLNIINRIRATSEHLGTRGDHELNATRTVLPSWWERFMIAPFGVNYHLEHHLFPSVPGCKLAKLHRELMKDPEYRDKAHVTKTYVGVIRELMTPGTAEPDSGRDACDVPRS